MDINQRRFCPNENHKPILGENIVLRDTDIQETYGFNKLNLAILEQVSKRLSKYAEMYALIGEAHADNMTAENIIKLCPPEFIELMIPVISTALEDAIKKDIALQQKLNNYIFGTPPTGPITRGGADNVTTNETP